jgi:hypothetical protein
MKTFFEWMTELNEAGKGHKDLAHPLHSILAKHNIVSLTPKTKKKKKKTRKPLKIKKPEPAPMIHVDMDRWMQAVSALAKDLEEYKKVKKQADDKMAALEKKKKEQERVVAQSKKQAPVKNVDKAAVPKDDSNKNKQPEENNTKKPESQKTIKPMAVQSKTKGKNVVSKGNVGKGKKIK